MNDDPIFNRAKIAECRENASRTRNRAMTVQDPDLRQTLIGIAKQWDILAGELEKYCDQAAD